MRSVLYYNCQGDRDVGRLSYGLSAVCAKATKKNKKIIENPLTNQKVYGIIKTQKGRNGEAEWCDPRESIRPVPMNRPQGVRICGI